MQVNAANHCCRAAAARHRGHAGDGVAIAQVGGAGGGCERNGGDVLGGQAEEFVALTDAVLVQVLPKLNFREISVTRVEHPVAVADRAGCAVAGVVGRKRFKAAARVAVVGLHHAGAKHRLGDGDERVNTKEFTAGVDGAVAVAVKHQPSIVGLDPAGTGFDAIGVVVEKDRVAGGGDADGFYAVAVKVNREGVTAGWVRCCLKPSCHISSYALEVPHETSDFLH